MRGFASIYFHYPEITILGRLSPNHSRATRAVAVYVGYGHIVGAAWQRILKYDPCHTSAI